MINTNPFVLMVAGGLLIFAAFFKRAWIPFLFVLYGCVSAFLYELYFVITPYKTFVMWCPILLLIQGRNKNYGQNFSPYILIFVSMAVSFSLSIYSSDFAVGTDASERVGKLLPSLRSLFNNLLYFFSFLLIPIISSNIKSSSMVVKVVKFYLMCTTVLCLYGLYQVLAYYAGLPFRPIWYPSLGTGIPTFTLMGVKFFRIYSLCSEPKILASILLPATFLFALPKEHLQMFFPKVSRARFLLIIHLLVAVGTFSTSVFFSYLVCAGYFIGLFSIRSKRFLFGLLCFLVLLLMVYFSFMRGSNLESWVKNIYAVRITEKVEKEQIVEKKIINFIKSHPEKLAFGVGAGNILYFLKNENGEIPEFSNSGILILITEFGLFGFFSWGWCVFRILQLPRFFYTSKGGVYERMARNLKMMVIVSCISFFFRDNIFLIIMSLILVDAFKRNWALERSGAG